MDADGKIKEVEKERDQQMFELTKIRKRIDID